MRVTVARAVSFIAALGFAATPAQAGLSSAEQAQLGWCVGALQYLWEIVPDQKAKDETLAIVKRMNAYIAAQPNAKSITQKSTDGRNDAMMNAAAIKICYPKCNTLQRDRDETQAALTKRVIDCQVNCVNTAISKKETACRDTSKLR
jgi:hypothetical protein